MQPVLYYDFASPDAYLAAERVAAALGTVPEYQPVRLDGLAAGGRRRLPLRRGGA